MRNLPKPECELGYPWVQLNKVLSKKDYLRLSDWMAGQTMAICEDHGGVCYSHDVDRFFDGLPIID